MFSDSLGIVKSISVLLAVTRPVSDCCELPLKSTEEDEKEATVSLAIAEEMVQCGGIIRRDGIFTFTFGGKDVFASFLLWQEFSRTL